MGNKPLARCLSLGLVFALSALTGCSSTDNARPPVTADAPLTVMSFSIRLGLGRGDPLGNISRMQSQWGRNLDAVIEAIRAADPDIVGLQAVAGPDQLREIAEELDLNSAFVWHESEIDPKPWWGVGILSKFPIVATDKIPMSEDRNFIVATIDVGGKKIAVASIHRSHLDSSEDSIRLLMGRMGQSTLPSLITGNFNLLPNARTLKSPRRYQLQPVLGRFLDTGRQAQTKGGQYARQAGTWHGGGRVDYVFAEKDRFSVVDAGVVSGKHRDASDHMPYFAKLIFKDRSIGRARGGPGTSSVQ